MIIVLLWNMQSAVTLLDICAGLNEYTYTAPYNLPQAEKKELFLLQNLPPSLVNCITRFPSSYHLLIDLFSIGRIKSPICYIFCTEKLEIREDTSNLQLSQLGQTLLDIKEITSIRTEKPLQSSL